MNTVSLDRNRKTESRYCHGRGAVAETVERGPRDTGHSEFGLTSSQTEDL